jgi:BON domain-containing protein
VTKLFRFELIRNASDYKEKDMANHEAEHRRIVVETPTARREEVHSESVHHPERTGVSGAALAAIVVGVVALAAILILFVMNQQQANVNDNMTAQQQQPPQTIVQQPAQQPPIIVQQPAPATQPAPVIIQQAPVSGGTTPTTSGSNDSAIQAAVDKKLSDDPILSALGVTASVVEGKVTLMGSVRSQAEKNQVERAVRNVKGVKAVDNQITIS